MSSFISFFGANAPIGPNPGHGSFDFDGTDDFMQLSSAPLTSAPCTIAAWAVFDTFNTRALTAIGDSGGSSRLQLDQINTADIAARSVNSGGTDTAATAGNITTVGFHHCVAVFSSTSNRKAYLDGSGGGADGDSNVVSGLNATTIGVRYNGGVLGAHFNGRLSHVAIWNIALNDAEIASLAGGAKPNTVQVENLVFYAPLTNGNAIDVVSGTPLTVTGATSNAAISPAGV